MKNCGRGQLYRITEIILLKDIKDENKLKKLASVYKHFIKYISNINNKVQAKYTFYCKSKTEYLINKSTAYVNNACLSGANLKFLVKKRHNSKPIAFRVMPLVPQLHLVMMSKYPKFGVHTFNTF